MDAVFEDKELGRIEMVRNDNAKHIRIAIKPELLRITIPYWAKEKDALDFLNKVRPKIIEKQQKVQSHKLIIDETHPLQTLSFVTQVQAADRDKVFFRMKDGILLIEYPQAKNCHSEQLQSAFKQGVEYFLRKEAKRMLPSRLEQLSKEHGFTYSDLKIQSSKTRWGSCSGRKSINLSFYLLLLPKQLIDYVILHELCHTIEMNHGDRFWKLMDKVTDNKAKALRAQVKRFRCEL